MIQTIAFFDHATVHERSGWVGCSVLNSRQNHAKDVFDLGKFPHWENQRGSLYAETITDKNQFFL